MKRIIAAFCLLIFLSACNAQAGKENGRKIFNGTNLDGWSADTTFWSVKDGSIVGEVTPEKQLPYNTFCIWKGEKPSDFELRAKVRITSEGNSGIQYR
ncbi:MAG: family 16 glycoside hydrolase, partial [Flavitalea sp.]